MKYLFVLRHMKSGWPEPHVDDRDRELAPRGVRDAALLAAHIAEAPIRPDLVLCSPARRTRSTLDAIHPGLGDAEVQIVESLYGASADEALSLIRGLPADLGSVMLIGHNPGLEDLVELLAAEGDDEAMTQLHTKFPAGALATLDLGITDWATVDRKQAYLRSIVIPGQLPVE